MSSIDERFHEEWLGLVQPVDGLVVSIPVLVEAQCMSRQPAETQRRLADLCHASDGSGNELAFNDLSAFLVGLLAWRPEQWDVGDALPPSFSLPVPEGGQTIRPTLALKSDEGHVALLWDLGPTCTGMSLDKPETKTGAWEYPATAKFDRLLRHARIPIGILTNQTHVRLLYAPTGESSGSITFRLADMATVGGRPILDAFVMLLSATRFFGVAIEHRLPAILADSRKHQANVTNELADQVFDALQILLRGFESAAERDGRDVLDDALARPDDHLYGGLLKQLLRLVFVLYAEDRGLLPVDDTFYAGNLSALGLFEHLQQDYGAFPDSMSRRFGAYGRLATLFRAIYLGVEHGTLRMPPRHGQLFSPHEHPFLEGWRGEPGSAPIVDPAARAETRLPSVDDETVFRVLERLLIFKKQRLSYRALDVEQIGSVYEALMGYHVVRLIAPAICLRQSRVWVTADEIRAEEPALRARWLQAEAGLAKGQAEKLAKALTDASDDEAILEVLEEYAVSGEKRRPIGRLVVQPGAERRRTSSHYTPRSLTAPIVRTTIEPLLRAMGENPSSERILTLKICDPAVGSGAFLVEACRFLADQVVLAWTRERRRDLLTGKEDATLVARRLVAQRCLYGVDKNAFAVNLAKLSLWLVTLAKDLPFTFLDHALRHGDSLVGLSLEQITAFHWKPSKQVDLCRQELEATLSEAITARQKIIELAADPSPAAQKEKEWLLRDAEDALERIRLIGDLVVGAFFSVTKDKEREKERDRRLDLVFSWLREGGAPSEELIDMRRELRARLPPFHWMAEYPEVFWVERPDPLDADRTGQRAWIDAFVGNPPFMGVAFITEQLGEGYVEWLQHLHAGTQGKFDLAAQFFRRASDLLGDHGTMGLLATKTIAQGDTRATGLQPLLGEGLRVYEAIRSMPWPGEAAVAVSVVHLEKGKLASASTGAILDGLEVKAINSRLRAGHERADPIPLGANASLSFIGSYIAGMGFVLSPEEREVLVAKDKKNAELIRPYIGGEEINTSPVHAFERYVIDFGDMTLEHAERWPDLVAIVRQRVKPERDRANREAHKRNWWHFGDKRPGLYATARPLERCLVTSLISKHRAFVWQPTDRVWSHNVGVFTVTADWRFAAMQSRVHEIWARLLSSTLEDRSGYRPSDCFETFPFPHTETRASRSVLDDAGRDLYDSRSAYMVATQRGLTDAYNRLKDPDCSAPEIEALRTLHLDLDRAVLAAYGWAEIQVPGYATPTSSAERTIVAAFEDEVVDRLFALNAERTQEERIRGNASPPTSVALAKKGRSAKGVPTSQLVLPGGREDPS